MVYQILDQFHGTLAQEPLDLARRRHGQNMHDWIVMEARDKKVVISSKQLAS